MTSSDAAPFPLGVSFRFLDREQRLETIALLAGSPVKSVELWEPGFGKNESHVQEARRAFAAAGVAPRSVHSNFAESLDISSPDSAARAAGVHAVGLALDLAVRMGAPLVIVHASSEPIAPHARPTRMAESKRSIQIIAEIAQQAGCRIAVELLLRTCLGRSAAELLDLLEGMDAETAGVCLDTNHLMGDFASLPAIVRSLGPRLLTLHCSDYDGIDEKHWPPMRGVIDWRAFLAVLRDAGYCGPFHYEATLDGESPAERLAFLAVNFDKLVSCL